MECRPLLDITEAIADRFKGRERQDVLIFLEAAGRGLAGDRDTRENRARAAAGRKLVLEMVVAEGLTRAKVLRETGLDF